MQELLEQIKVVAEAREREEALRSEEFRLRNEWNVTNEKFLNELDQSKKFTLEAEAKLRELTIEVFKNTGNKSPAPGVGIREITKLDYDTDKAFRWAVEHNIALSLNKNMFEKLAKDTPIDFVTMNTEIQATIAKELILTDSETQGAVNANI